MRYTVEVDDGGTTIWYKEGTTIRHRIGGPARIYADGNEEWFEEDLLHRIGSPARTRFGREEFFYMGKWHNLEGPAIKALEGSHIPDEYWIFGNQFTKKNFDRVDKSCPEKYIEVRGKLYKEI